MGRRKDDPALQRAKGYPGRRKVQTDREIEAAAVSAERETAELDPFAIPAIFKGAPTYYRRAIVIWNSQATTLRTGGRRRPGYRGALTRYCIWSQIYETAVEQLRRECPKGDFVIDWTPVNGTTRKVPHPSLKVMKEVEPILRAIEDDFGFTPRSDVHLVRVETFNRSVQNDLFAPRAGGGAAGGGEDASGDPMDLMADTDSPPPTLN